MARTYRVDASGFPYWNKDPEARLDYSFDWSEWLPAGCVIASVAHTVPAGLTLLAQSYTSTTTTVWLTSGVAGSNYSVEAKVFTNSAGNPVGIRIDERTFRIRCKER